MKSLRESIYSSNHVSIRKQLISKRKQLKLSQRDLAVKLGINHSLIGKIETGDRRLDLLEFIEYIKPLNLSLSDFFKINYPQIEKKVNIDIFNNKQQKKLYIAIKDKLSNLNNICINFDFTSPNYEIVHKIAFEIMIISQNQNHVNNPKKILDMSMILWSTIHILANPYLLNFIRYLPIMLDREKEGWGKKYDKAGGDFGMLKEINNSISLIADPTIPDNKIQKYFAINIKEYKQSMKNYDSFSKNSLKR